MKRAFDVGTKVINITVDINNIPESLPESKRHKSGGNSFNDNAFTAFRNHRTPTATKEIQPYLTPPVEKSYKEEDESKGKTGSNNEDVAKLVEPVVVSLHRRPSKLVSLIKQQQKHHKLIVDRTNNSQLFSCSACTTVYQQWKLT